MSWVGIDYGSKVAGTTVICQQTNNSLTLECSTKGQDADKMILSFCDIHQPTKVFLDAPLSLPLAYFDQGDNYFYRLCDKELKAMSPMFLGGLTARAMSLKSKLVKLGIEVFETYPGGLVKILPILSDHYNKKEKPSDQLLSLLTQLTNYHLGVSITNYHQVDSILAWYSGYRYDLSNHKSIGDPMEGVIII